MKVNLTLECDDFNPEDSSELIFKRLNGGWLSRDELLKRIEDALDKTIALMDVHDSITIKIEVQ